MDKIKATNVDFYYGNFHALKNISLTIPENQVVAFIGHRVAENRLFCVSSTA